MATKKINITSTTKQSATRKKPATKTKRVVKKVVKKTTKRASKKKAQVSNIAIADRTQEAEIKDVCHGHNHDHTPIVIPRNKVLPTVKREPLGHLLVEQLLREGGFRGDISTDAELLESYSTDESIFAIKPQIVIQPKDGKDVERAVKIIARETKRFSALSLTPRAAGTGLSGGSLTDSIVIDVCKYMHHIHDITERSGQVTFTAEPGVMWRTIEKKLKQKDVYIPSFPASKDICSIGGAVGNNSAGPDSLRFGHCANWVASLDVVLHDGKTYTIRPMSYKEYQALIKKKDAYATILKEVFTIIEKNESTINKARPKTKKNSAGFPLWDCLDGTVAEFKKGKATLDMTRLISGSQGTIGIITSITMRTEPIMQNTALVAIPVFNLADAGNVVIEALKYNPINVEVFDGLSFDLALQNPDFFKDRLEGAMYYKVLLSMYTTYHVRWRRKTPEFTLLVTIDEDSAEQHGLTTIVGNIREAGGDRARFVQSPVEREMFWQVRRASYSLSKFQDTNKRPAAFLEDMTVPPENLSAFFTEIKALLKKFNVTAAVHGHGGNGHFHFYPLLDFTKQGTADLVEKMSETFFNTAIKYKGNICGEHNDGIIRTPHLNKMFNKKTLDLFKKVEHTFDPDDIFNPGKKVNPRFDVKETLRKTN